MKMLVRSLFAASLALALFAAPVHAADLSLDGNLRGACGTVTETAGAGTLSNKCGTITTASLTAPAASEYTVTLTNTVVAAADIVLWSVGNGSNTTGQPTMGRATPAAGSVVFVVRQGSGVNFDGTLRIKYFVIKP